MKKLYIPVSTFNFNNILSSESISPKAFYEQRGFGYSRWLSIPENNLDNIVLLYDKPFKFSRPMSDVEDHPMLIEIKTDESFPQTNEGIFYSDHTIYLSPYRTRFIFFTEQVKRVVMSLSDSSLETKMMRIYGKRFIVETPINQDIPKISLNINLNEDEIKKDFQINKMKGLLYGYYIGALLSTTPELVKKNNLLLELQDIFYSVLSSEEKRLTSSQNERLSTLLTDLNNLAIIYLQKQLANPNIIEAVVNQLKKLGVTFSNSINKIYIINSLTDSKGENSKAIKWLKKELQQLEQEIYQDRKLLSVSEEEIVVGDYCLSKISSKVISNLKDNKLVINWINDVLSSKNYNGNISSFKEALSDEITKKAKSLYQENWESSFAKQTLNQIRKYVRGQESSFQWDNGIYSSIAAVLSKGNNWTDLLAFMKRKGMTDYRLAFAFYGELNGFANLTRDFTDNLLNIENREYLIETYKEFYGQLLGVDPTYNNVILPSSNTPIDIDKDKTQMEIQIIMQAWDKIKKGKRKQDKLLEGLKEALNQCRNNLQIQKFLETLSSYEGWNKKNVVWNEMYSELLPNDNRIIKSNISRKKKIEQTPNLFDIPKELPKKVKNHQKGDKGKFTYLNIDSIIDVIIKEFSYSNERIVSNLKNDLNWVLDPKYSVNQTSNELIDKFKDKLIEGASSPVSKNGKDMSWKNQLYRKIDIEAIIKKLHLMFD